MPPPNTIRKRKRKNRRTKSLAAQYWYVLLILAAASVFLLYRQFAARRIISDVRGYATEEEVLRRQYERAMVKPIDSSYRSSFRDAAVLVNKGEFERALAILEPLARKVPLPIVLNDIGVLYHRRRDLARAIKSFRQSLTLDQSYAPAYSNLELITANLNVALPRETEPNNAQAFADLLSVGQALDAEVQTAGDRDYFYFVVPSAPRDRFEVAIQSQSPSLKATVQLYDESGKMQGGSVAPNAGDSLNCLFSPAPDSKVFIVVSGDKDTSGAYSLSVKPRKSFDAYEPNDDMASAKHIEVGTRIQANIMDADDNDFYSFVSPRTGTVTIEVQAQGKLLSPAMTIFLSDWRTSGISPSADSSGKIRETLTVDERATYYLEVRPLAGTSGDYTLIIQ